MRDIKNITFSISMKHSSIFICKLMIILPWMWIDPFKLLLLKSSSLSEAMPLSDDRKLLLKLLSFK